MRLRHLFHLIRKRQLLSYLRAAWMTRRYVDEWTVFPAFEFRKKGRIKILKHPTARLVIHGVLIANPWPNSEAPCLIELQEGSSMKVVGRWSMKDDARIKLFPGARFNVEGVRGTDKASSMLGSRSQILVANQVDIGANCAISWDVAIMDSNWHAIEGKVKVAPVRIGDHVWVASRSTVLPGATIAEDSVVGTGSVVVEGHYPKCALLTGAPAEVARIMEQPWRL